MLKEASSSSPASSGISFSSAEELCAIRTLPPPEESFTPLQRNFPEFLQSASCWPRLIVVVVVVVPSCRRRECWEYNNSGV